jgi:hypothetical protein
MLSLKKLASVLIMSGAFFANGEAYEDKNKEMMVNELETIKHIVENNYAPAQWKKEFLGWDVSTEIEKSKKRVLSTPNITEKDFQTIIRDFFRSTRDYHVGVHFYATESAFLPIEVKSAEGKYFISHVYTSLLSESSYPINVGDEIVSFGDRPIADVVEELQLEEFGTTGPGTDRELTQLFLTERGARSGHVIPRGPVSLELMQNGQLRSYQLIWNYTPEKVTQNYGNVSNLQHQKQQAAKPTSKLKERLQKANKSWMTPYLTDLTKLEKQAKKFACTKFVVEEEEDADEELDLSPHALGSQTGFIPPLGKMWWVNEGFFKAYIFETPEKKLVGYLRIPSYADFEIFGFSLAELIFIPELKGILALFEERTEALVIDQTNNPGGSVFYLYTIASLLSDKPLKTPKHQMIVTHADVLEASSAIVELEKIKSDEQAVKLLGNTFGGYPVSHQMTQFLLEFYRFQTEQWKSGKRLTDPFYLLGVDHINPCPEISYSKPILFLINHLDFSGGDFLPTILQDNKRALIFGTQTAGAGGYVLGYPITSRFGISAFSLTGSLAKRVEGKPIENLGVTPDIVYEMTENDLRYGYPEYSQAIRETLKTLIE